MGTKRTHEPGVWIDILKAEDLDYIACGSYIIITVDGRRVPGGYGVPLPSSGRVPIGSARSPEPRHGGLPRHPPERLRAFAGKPPTPS